MARAVHLSLPWSSPFLLALGTWLVYVADRILDGLRDGDDVRLRERHLLYARHRGKLLAAAAFASAALIWLVAAHMNAAARHEDVALFVAALVYFVLIHLCGRLSKSGIERWFPKEIAVAAVFSAAVAVPAWSRMPADRMRLVPLVALFAMLCWLNCVAIEKWERSPRAAVAASRVFPHVTTRWAQLHFCPLSLAIAALAIAACIWAIFSGGRGAGCCDTMAVLYLSCAISALLFPALDRSHLESRQLRIAADAALLTPLLFIAILY